MEEAVEMAERSNNAFWAKREFRPKDRMARVIRKKNMPVTIRRSEMK
jgi:hypothetical protein